MRSAENVFELSSHKKKSVQYVASQKQSQISSSKPLLLYVKPQHSGWGSTLSARKDKRPYHGRHLG